MALKGLSRDWLTLAVLALLALVIFIPWNYMSHAALVVGPRFISLGWLVFVPAGALLLAFCSARAMRESRFPTVVLWTGAIAASLFASSAVAEFPMTALSTSAGFSLRCLPMAWAGFYIGRNPASLARFVRGAAILGAMLALSGLYEVTTGRWFLIERTIGPEQALGELWGPGQGVATAAIGQPLPFSAVSVLFLPLAIWQAVRSKNRAWMLPCFLVALGILATYRRSGYALLLLIALLAVWRFGRHPVRVLAGACVLMAGFLLLPAVQFQVSERFNVKRTIAELTGHHRGRVYSTTWRVVKSHPALGIGTRQYERTYSRYATYEGAVNTQDSQYLRTAAENGILGLVALLGFLGYVMVTLLRSPSPDAWPFGVAASAFALVLLFLDALYWPAPAMTFFAVAGAGCGASDGARDKR